MLRTPIWCILLNRYSIKHISSGSLLGVFFPLCVLPSPGYRAFVTEGLPFGVACGLIVSSSTEISSNLLEVSCFSTVGPSLETSSRLIEVSSTERCRIRPRSHRSRYPVAWSRQAHLRCPQPWSRHLRIEDPPWWLRYQYWVVTPVQLWWEWNSTRDVCCENKSEQDVNGLISKKRFSWWKKLSHRYQWKERGIPTMAAYGGAILEKKNHLFSSEEVRWGLIPGHNTRSLDHQTTINAQSYVISLICVRICGKPRKKTVLLVSSISIGSESFNPLWYLILFLLLHNLSPGSSRELPDMPLFQPESI